MTTTTRSSLSVVIPVYNSAATLPDLVERLDSLLREIASAFEIILVNDGSRDESFEVAQQLAQKHPSVVPIDLMRNYGQHNALLCGIRAAKHELIVTLDDDLQHSPEDIQRLLERLGTKYDVVYGTPRAEPHGFWRGLASRVTKFALQRAMGAEIARNVSAFRLFRTCMRDAFADYRSPHVSIDILLTWSTTRFAAVEVEHQPRRHGVSNYSFGKLVTHALNMVTGFTTLPLQLASWIGFVFTFVGVVVFGFVLVRYLTHGTTAPGFPFLASVIAIFSGAQLFALGIIGEYLARMHFRMMARPAYVIREPR